MSDRGLGLRDRTFSILSARSLPPPDPALRIRHPCGILLWENGSFRAWIRHRDGRIDRLGLLRCADAEERAVGETATALARLRREARDVVLRLPGDCGLLRREILPAQAARELDNVLRHRIDVLTPWAAEQCLYHGWITGRRRDGRIEVAVAAAPRAPFEAALAGVRRFGLEPDVCDFAVGDPTAPPAFDLRPGIAGRASRSRRRLTALVAALLLLVGGGLLVERLASYRAASERAKARIEELREQLQRIEPQPAAGGPTAQVRSTIQEFRAAHPSPLSLLDALSRLLPDEVWLDRLLLEGRRLELHGYAADSARLLALMERSPLFAGTRFLGPTVKVRRLADGGAEETRERFLLETRVQALPGELP